MKQRIFLAIPLPENIQEKVGEKIQEWHWLPIRWLAPEDWHVTLIPPVYLEEDEIARLVALLHQRMRFKPFPFAFERMVLAPPGAAARMVWLEGATPPELARLATHLRREWASDRTLPQPNAERRPLRLHATLARFEAGALRDLERRSRVLETVRIRANAHGVSVFASRLRPSGAEYQSVVTLPFAADSP